MYEYVTNSESRQFRQVCSDILTKTRDNLRDNYDIISQFTLVGSGARNLITRDGNGQYDLDYNLEILKAPDSIWNNLRFLKDTVRNCLNQAIGGSFSDWQDSTSVLTSLLYFEDNRSVKFRVDVAIVKKDSEGNLERLIHMKSSRNIGIIGHFMWNKAPDSHDVFWKARIIKEKGQWFQVRNKYLELKNMYLERQDNDHPSFIVYVEAVNEIYYKIKGGTRK